MIKRWLRKYFATVFVLATLMGVFHHHSDLSVHEDCQICTIQSDIANGDIPRQTQYLSEVKKVSDTPLLGFNSFSIEKVYNPLNSRAPPKNS